MNYEEPYRVPVYLGNQKGQISLGSAVDIALMGSEHQLDQLDAGISSLAKHGAGWVITQYEMTINRMPKAEEELILGTAATTYNKLMTYRDYWIKDVAGDELLRFTGAWVMMDLTTRKLIPVIADFAERVGAPFDTHVKRFPRLAKLSGDVQAVPYRVRYFDIDENGHVHNTRYLDWMEDSLGADFLNSHELTGASIKYAREVAYGTQPEAQFTVSADGLDTAHQVVTAGVVNAEAQLRWRDRR
ncbi:acyl-[acyl-carrier-protein] thioesterase [Lacticaseibacillus yichunensis]|uniref:Acyl-[acyl-carrier-protein] thioesterase n=1 Tax=Lacticaseibacillus yichunensis TaxID=2486015 RepID=A0ABW4CL62_9LACO|nr:acyl-ACP thioesterase domain-containing protein [Lacticaseibacillus yichunensis]